MKILLSTSLPLRPFFERLLPASPHEVELLCFEEEMPVPELLEQQLARVTGCDAILLPDGAAILGETGLRAGSIPLVLPRVHNCVALLLGGADRYRGLFERYQGGICWQTAGLAALLGSDAQEAYSCLCYLADTQLGLRDTSVEAQAAAKRYGWDFFEAETDLSLIERMLAGDWDTDAFLTVRPGEQVLPSYTRTLMEAAACR